MVVSPWARRRRVVGKRFDGADFSAEIDLPYHGPHWFTRPAGGRITGAAGTWIELTPAEAEEVSLLCHRAASEVLQGWLQARGLYGRVRDHTGVATDVDFAQPGYRLRKGDSVIRPADDAAFRKNEAHIAHEVEREALRLGQHTTDEPTVVEYPGLFGVTSRCHAVHRREGNRVLFALGHIQHGGTSPTNMIEELTARMRRQFYPDVPLEQIEWFDAWPEHHSLTNRFHMQRVLFAADKKGARGGPVWVPADGVPEDFIEEVRRVITPRPSSSPAL